MNLTDFYTREIKSITLNVFGSLIVLTCYFARYLLGSYLNVETILISNLFDIVVTTLSDYEGDLSFMDDDDVDELDEITYTNSQQNRRSLTGTSITSMSEDRRSISTLNQQNFEEIIQDEVGGFHYKEQLFV